MTWMVMYSTPPSPTIKVSSFWVTLMLTLIMALLFASKSTRNWTLEGKNYWNRELLILNGTSLSNSGPTLLRTNAKTVIDYAVTSPHLFSSFIILDFMDESEHAPLSLSLNISHTLPPTPSPVSLDRKSAMTLRTLPANSSHYTRRLPSGII